MPKILVLHGPNLNLLGQRETHHYGNDSLDAINRRLVERIHAARQDGTAVRVPFIEVHLSNIHARKPFRHQRSIEPRSK